MPLPQLGHGEELRSIHCCGGLAAEVFGWPKEGRCAGKIGSSICGKGGTGQNARAKQQIAAGEASMLIVTGESHYLTKLPGQFLFGEKLRMRTAEGDNGRLLARQGVPSQAKCQPLDRAWCRRRRHHAHVRVHSIHSTGLPCRWNRCDHSPDGFALVFVVTKIRGARHDASAPRGSGLAVSNGDIVAQCQGSDSSCSHVANSRRSHSLAPRDGPAVGGYESATQPHDPVRWMVPFPGLPLKL